MSIIKKTLSLLTTATIMMSFAVMPQVEAAGEVTITPVVEVKLGAASYAAYDGQKLSAGDKVRIKYEYAGPAVEELWTEAWYDEDNEIEYEAELKGGKSIVLTGFYVDLLDKDYFTAGNPTFYVKSTAADWLTPSATYATTGKSDTGISFGSMAATVSAGIYKSSGRIAQVVYDVTKDLDKDVVIGAAADFNYQFKLATADIEGTETGSEVYETKNGGVVFNEVTLKAATIETHKDAEYILEGNDSNKAKKEVGEPYTQGFKVKVIPNDDTVNGLNFTLKTSDGNSKTYTGADAFQFPEIKGDSTIVLGLNVKEIPYEKSVTAEFVPAVVNVAE